MVYNRPLSIEFADSDYLLRYGSREEARLRLFNVGAGAWQHPFWSNIDLPAQTPEFAAIQAECIFHDLTSGDPLPVGAECADAFYTSHTVEHIPEEAVARLMREMYSALRPGGYVRISTGPDADTDWAAMMRGDASWWFWFQDPAWLESIGGLPPMSVEDAWLYSVATARSSYSRSPSDRKFVPGAINELIDQHRDEPKKLLDLVTADIPFDSDFPGNHISWWNADKLHLFLSQAGFETIHTSGYGQSAFPPMRDLHYFDQTYPQISVYVEAVK